MKYVGYVLIFVFMIGLGMYAETVVDESEKVTSNKATEHMEKTEEVQLEDASQMIVIDPGHGGEDPGKVGINGALEKDVNLVVANKVVALLLEKGFRVTMTRETDTGAGGNEQFSKVQDLEKRVSLINDSKAELVVSIHQNSYETEDIKGAQVFYYTHSTEGEKAAQYVQEALWEIDEENTRQIKDNNTYYLLCRTKIPTIIVECGFLSNMEEANKLIDDTYQTQVAMSIVKGIEAYLQE